MRRMTAITILPAAALALAACGTSTGDTTTPEPAASLATTTEGATASADDTATTATTAPSDDVEAGDELFGTAADVGGPYGELRDGVWGVGAAGEVEFTVTGSDSLELLGVEANAGWEITQQDVDSDSIDVDFRRGQVTYEFQVEMDEGILEIEIDQDIDRATSGDFAVGAAAMVPLTFDGARVTLGEVRLASGWTETGRDLDDDVEIDFRRDGTGFFELWEINADGDDPDVEIDYEIEGRFSS